MVSLAFSPLISFMLLRIAFFTRFWIYQALSLLSVCRFSLVLPLTRLELLYSECSRDTISLSCWLTNEFVLCPPLPRTGF
jgi:hypothetical protein